MRLKLLFFLLFLLNSALVSSQAIDIARVDYMHGETFQATVTVEDFKISKLSLEDNESNKLSIGFLALKKTEDQHLVYFDIPKALMEGQYTLRYYDGEGIINISEEYGMTGEFNVIEGTEALSINPPLVKLNPAKASFEITLTNKGTENMDIMVTSINPDIMPARESITVPFGESRKLFVNYAPNALSSSIQLDYNDLSYTIDIIGMADAEIMDIPSVITEEGIERPNALEILDKRPIVHTITGQQIIAGQIEFENTHTEPLHNITFHTTSTIADIVDFNYSLLNIAEPDKTYQQFLWINKNKNAAPGFYYGAMLIRSTEGDTATLRISINVSEPEADIEEPIDEENYSEMVITPIGEEEESTFNVSEYEAFNDSEEGLIIVPDSELDEGGSSNRAIGIILLVVILAIGGFIVWKLRPKPQKKEFKEYIQPLRKGYQEKKS